MMGFRVVPLKGIRFRWHHDLYQYDEILVFLEETDMASSFLDAHTKLCEYTVR